MERDGMEEKGERVCVRVDRSFCFFQLWLIGFLRGGWLGKFTLFLFVQVGKERAEVEGRRQWRRMAFVFVY